MNCPICKSKLKCQDSRQETDFSRWREYACIKCDTVYLSDEKLDTEIIREKIHKRLKITGKE